MDEQLTLEEILREGMIGSPNVHSDDLQRAAERGDTEGKLLQTSQELSLFDCQVTNIVMNSDSQL